MTPICQNVHEEDSAQLKDLGSLPDRLPLKRNYGLQALISESGLYLLTSRRVRAHNVVVFA